MTEKVSTTLPYHGRGKWSPEATKLLVSLYEQHPCLYQRINPHYRNKQVRDQALQSITQLLDKSIHMNFTTKDVLTKINSIRTQFSVVHNGRSKRLTQITDPSDSAKRKEPSWWLYPHLNFLVANFRKNEKASQRALQQDNSEETTNNNTNEYQNNENVKDEVIECEDEEMESDEDGSESRVGNFDNGHVFDAEQKINASIVIHRDLVNPNGPIVQEVLCSPSQSQLQQAQQQLEECKHLPVGGFHTISNDVPQVVNNSEVQSPQQNVAGDIRNDYVPVSINHLKLELESIRNPQTQRILLRKMFQLVYDAQDQELDKVF